MNFPPQGSFQSIIWNCSLTQRPSSGNLDYPETGSALQCNGETNRTTSRQAGQPQSQSRRKKLTKRHPDHVARGEHVKAHHHNTDELNSPGQFSQQGKVYFI